MNPLSWVSSALALACESMFIRTSGLIILCVYVGGGLNLGCSHNLTLNQWPRFRGSSKMKKNRSLWPKLNTDLLQLAREHQSKESLHTHCWNSSSLSAIGDLLPNSLVIILSSLSQEICLCPSRRAMWLNLAGATLEHRKSLFYKVMRITFLMYRMGKYSQGYFNQGWWFW